MNRRLAFDTSSKHIGISYAICMPTRYFIINDEELGRIQSTNLMHLGFWVNENADKDVKIINHIACD